MSPKSNAKRLLVMVASVAAFLGFVVVLVSMVHGPRELTAPAGKLIFEDTFERSELGAGYTQSSADVGHAAGTWKLQDGRLIGENIHNAGLWLDRPLPERVRLEVDVRPETDVGDAKVEIFGDGSHHQSGYIAIMGGWKNTVNCLARQDEHSEERKEDTRCGRNRQCVQPGTEYHWTFERTDRVVRWYVDGQLFLVYDDAHPVAGRHFAFNVWEAKVTFDNLKVYDLSN
ncbi:MAG: hypothetical protein EXR76_06170 [Myxococcales bacterium]|nr:hypothetical protein [Myxococcales bacterium]